MLRLIWPSLISLVRVIIQIRELTNTNRGKSKQQANCPDTPAFEYLISTVAFSNSWYWGFASISKRRKAP
jgi:hypothetical protein